MIKNDRQYRITKAQAARFAHALEMLRKHSEEKAGVHPLLRKAEREALESQLADLNAQMAEYEALRSGRRSARLPDSLEELPRALIEARIAAGWSQRELAEHLGLKEQQIQRYEATGYAAASLERVQSVAHALGVRLRQREAHSPLSAGQQ
jgi:ribosome-binding protein aMBF1 (putative translation factor)